jgi:hypothetical protein
MMRLSTFSLFPAHAISSCRAKACFVFHCLA